MNACKRGLFLFELLREEILAGHSFSRSNFVLVLDSRSEGEIVLRKRDLNFIIGGILLDCYL